MKVVDRLLADHKAFRKLLDDLDGIARLPPGSRDMPRSRRLAAVLTRMVLSHAAFEDTVFFPAVGKTGKVATDLLEHLTHEHKTIEGYLTRLTSQLKPRPASPAWPQTFALLAAGLRGHLKREEEDVFPASEEVSP